MPDYMLVFAVPILAHLPAFTAYDDPDSLTMVKEALFFVLEPLITKNENFSFNFYKVGSVLLFALWTLSLTYVLFPSPLKAMLEKMKTHKDRLLPGDESGNYKMWAACDLATGLLISKTTNYELKEYPRVSYKQLVLLLLLAYPSFRENIRNRTSDVSDRQRVLFLSLPCPYPRKCQNIRCTAYRLTCTLLQIQCDGLFVFENAIIQLLFHINM